MQDLLRLHAVSTDQSPATLVDFVKTQSTDPAGIGSVVYVSQSR